MRSRQMSTTTPTAGLNLLVCSPTVPQHRATENPKRYFSEPTLISPRVRALRDRALNNKNQLVLAVDTRVIVFVLPKA